MCGNGCTGISAYERMGRACRKAKVPRKNVPCDCAYEATKEHPELPVWFNLANVHHVARNGFCHSRSKESKRNKVKERGPDYCLKRRKNARRNDRGYGVSRVMPAVYIVED